MPNRGSHEVRELLAFDPSTARRHDELRIHFRWRTIHSRRSLCLDTQSELNLEQLDTIVLIDKYAQFSGAVSVARLLLAPLPINLWPTLKIRAAVSVHRRRHEKDVFELFDKYNLRSLTVIDDLGSPIGTIDRRRRSLPVCVVPNPVVSICSMARRGVILSGDLTLPFRTID